MSNARQIPAAFSRRYVLSTSAGKLLPKSCRSSSDQPVATLYSMFEGFTVFYTSLKIACETSKKTDVHHDVGRFSIQLHLTEQVGDQKLCTYAVHEIRRSDLSVKAIEKTIIYPDAPVFEFVQAECSHLVTNWVVKNCLHEIKALPRLFSVVGRGSNNSINQHRLVMPTLPMLVPHGADRQKGSENCCPPAQSANPFSRSLFRDCTYENQDLIAVVKSTEEKPKSYHQKKINPSLTRQNITPLKPLPRLTVQRTRLQPSRAKFA